MNPADTAGTQPVEPELLAAESARSYNPGRWQAYEEFSRMLAAVEPFNGLRRVLDAIEDILCSTERLKAHVVAPLQPQNRPRLVRRGNFKRKRF